MDVEAVRWLTSAAGRRVLEEARATRGLAAHRRPAALAAAASADRVRLALLQDDLRRRAAPRCPHAEALLFTAEALEQATAWPVAKERATRWASPPERPLADLTAGVGFDALATARSGRSVVAFERDPVRARLLVANAVALKVEERVEVREADAVRAAPEGPLALLDPARRNDGRRTRTPARFAPPASAWPPLLGRFARAQVKLPPVVRGPLPIEAPSEWVSLDGRLRERRLWVGDWPARPPRRALRLPEGTAVEGEGRPWPAPRAAEEGLWLLDPDPAVTVAGLVGDLAHRDGLAPIHPRIAYLVGAAREPRAPGTWMRIEARLPPRPRRIQAWLDAVGGARPVVRTRGVAAAASDLVRRLRARGAVPTTVVLTRGADDRWIALAGRMEGGEARTEGSPSG